jgi:hypothetical protein
MWDLKFFNIYTLCSQKKVMFFQYEIKKLFWFKYFNLKE